ncbi:hypothetical protein AB0A71_42340 [Kitasatospora aureofaciens]|uniref:hypothetical protein n=1 Tax=Kitasatospora aureofaciens TaxID=1894 RepID=UPI0033EA11EA
MVDDRGVNTRWKARRAAVHRVGDYLERAAGALHAADRLRGTLFPVVNHHLRHAVAALNDARACLLGRAVPAAFPPVSTAPPV